MKKNIFLIGILLLPITTLPAFDAQPFAVTKTGQGEQAVIFIPGFACSGDVWNETVQRYASKYQCFVLTMAGFAGVPPQPKVDFSAWVESIAQFVIKNGLNKPIIIGHSMGGGIAMAIAADYPELVSKIVIVDALPFLAKLMNPLAVANGNPDCYEQVERFTSMSDEQFIPMQKHVLTRMVVDKEHADQILQWTIKSDRQTMGEIFCQFSNMDFREKLTKITCPSIILLESYFVNFSTQIEEQYQNLKGAQLQYAPQGLHFIMYDAKDWYFQKMDGILK